MFMFMFMFRPFLLLNRPTNPRGHLPYPLRPIHMKHNTLGSARSRNRLHRLHAARLVVGPLNRAKRDTLIQQIRNRVSDNKAMPVQRKQANLDRRQTF